MKDWFFFKKNNLFVKSKFGRKLTINCLDYLHFNTAQLRIISLSALPSYPPPIIEHGHSNQTLMVGASAMLPCTASGRSMPQISWLKNGEQIDLEHANFETRFKQLSSGSLQIDELK